MEKEGLSSKYLMLFLDHMPYMAWFKDTDGRFIVVNQSFADGCGLSKEEIIGKTDHDIWPEELANAYRKDDMDVIMTGQRKFVEEPIKDKTGGIWFETFKAPVYDEDNNLIGTMGTAKDISVRKKIHLELEYQKQFIRTMIDAIPDLVFFKDTQSVYLGCNHAFANRFIGLNEEEIVGKTDSDLFLDQELAHFFRQKDLDAMACQMTSISEENLIMADGSMAIVETAKTPFLDEKGNLAGLIGIARDITLRKNIESKLKESEIRLSLATDSAEIGLWDWRVQTGETVFNEQWASIIGYTLSELEPISIQTWIDVTEPEDLKRSMAVIEEYFSGKTERYECEIRIKHKLGHWVWVLDKGRVTEWDDSGKPLRMLGTHIDITERKLIEEDLRRKEKILSAVAMSIKELIDNRDYVKAIVKCFDLIGKATLVDRVYLFVNNYDTNGNAFTSQIIEWNSDEVEPQLDNPDLKNIPFNEIETFIAPLMKGEAYYGIVRHMSNDRVRQLLEAQNILSIVVLPIYIRGVFWGFIGFDDCKYEQDWTETEFSTLSAFANSIEKSIERSFIENELEASKHSAETANVLKSQFVANMSHEIRTPMHAIIGYASLMKDIVKDEEGLTYLSAIQKAGDALMHLLNDILDLSKIEAGNMEIQTGHVDIRRLLQDLRDIFVIKAKERGIELVFDVDPSFPGCAVLDEVRLRQILFNLVGNAVKFTEKGFVKVSAISKKVGTEPDRFTICLMVEDTGIGIPDSQQNMIFEPFKQQDGQSNKRFGGTGLGLSISKRLAEMMGGTISVISSPGNGARFTVELSNVVGGERSCFGDNLVWNEENDFNINKQVEIKSHKMPGPVAVDMSSEMRIKLEYLKEQLWQKCMNNVRVSDIREFSLQLLQVGNDHDAEDIIRYAKELKRHIDAYDIRSVKEILERYPDILKGGVRK